MNELINYLNKKRTSYKIGMIHNGYFYENMQNPSNKQVIYFNWKKDSIKNIIYHLNKENIIIKEKYIGKYNALYDIEGTNYQIFITYVVNSHIQLPRLLLKHFKTDNILFYLNPSDNKIRESSIKKYNTSLGYYSLQFEEYLSKNYEIIMSDIIQTILSIANNKKQVVILKEFKENVNKLFLMSIVRNPKYIKMINEHSVFSPLFKDGYDTEFLTMIGEREKKYYLEKYIPIPMINNSNKGIVTIKSLFSNISIDNNIKCAIILLHPKLAIILLPKKYHKRIIEEQGEQTYLRIIDDKEIIKLNQQIYNYAKINKEDVIGKKGDIEDIINSVSEKNH